jgi:hypothetical protein
MATRIGVAEFLKKVSRLKKTQEKIDALKANDSYVLRVVLQAAFDPSIKFAVPEEDPPYTPSKLPDQENVLIHDARKIGYFIEGMYPNIPKIKREAMFIEMLEAVAPEDAALLCAIKCKKLHVGGITKDHVLAALPGLFQPTQNA